MHCLQASSNNQRIETSCKMSVGTHTHSNICYNIANRKSVSTHLQQQQKKRINNEEENIEMKNSVYVRMPIWIYIGIRIPTHRIEMKEYIRL